MKIYSNILICFFLIGTLVSNAQEVSASKFKLGLHYAYDNNLSSERTETANFEGYNNNYNQHNFTLAISAEFLLSQNFAFVSGVNYSKKDLTSTYFCDVCTLTFTPQAQEIKFRFVELPLKGRYYFNLKKFSIYGDLGVINQFQVADEVEFVKQRYSLSGIVGLGTQYNISPNLSLELSLNYINGLTKIIENADYDYRIIGFGIGIVRAF